MRIPIAKLKAILRYFGTYTDPKFLGKVKLMKLFYFLDFIHVKKYGMPVTYDRYVNLEHGPIPSTILNLVNQVLNDPDHAVLADTIEMEVNPTSRICRITPVKKFTSADEQYFSNAELDVLQTVVSRYGDKNTRDIEDASHGESPWKLTKFLDEIPYTLATKDSDSAMSEEEVTLMMDIYGRN